MPNLNEFIDKPSPSENINENLERIEGIRGCSKCKEDVEGAYWDHYDKKMTWTCSQGHVTEFQVD